MKQQAALFLNRSCNFTLAKTSGSGYIMMTIYVVNVAQLVVALGCGPGGRGFESHHSPHPWKRNFRPLPEIPFFIATHWIYSSFHATPQRIRHPLYSRNNPSRYILSRLPRRVIDLSLICPGVETTPGYLPANLGRKTRPLDKNRIMSHCSFLFLTDNTIKGLSLDRRINIR